MAYCVKCGVELDESAKKCALCSTPLVLPQGLELDQGAATPFPEKVQLPAEVRRRYLVFFVSMVMLIPNIVLIITNFLLPSTGLWALYVASSSALAWVLFVYPFLWKRQKPYLLITVDALATALYIYVFYALGKEKGWFFYLALPIVCLLTLSLYITTFWIRRARRDWPEIINMILLQIGACSLCVDLLLHYYLYRTVNISFSLVIVASCLALVIFFLAVGHNRRLRAWLSRKFFV